MDINRMVELAGNPLPYDKGTAQMWTDPYIAKQLQHMHTDGGHDMASRKTSGIEKTLDWVMAKLEPGAKVLDIGCGPGLYTQRLARAGFDVTGVDFSQPSIDYARTRAKEEKLDIRYICGNYLDADFGKDYDAALLIYCDFGVLDPNEQQGLLGRISDALKPGGRFIFDAMNEKSIANMDFSRSWETSDGGFWRPAPYTCLADKRHYPDNKAILDQHIVIEQEGDCEVYRFWNHYFSTEDVDAMAEEHGFAEAQADVLFAPGGGMLNDDGVTFYTLTKG